MHFAIKFEKMLRMAYFWVPQPPMSDWGSMVKENLSGLIYGSVAPLMPALAIATLTISVNMIVDDISAATGGKLAKRMIS